MKMKFMNGINGEMMVLMVNPREYCAWIYIEEQKIILKQQQ